VGEDYPELSMVARRGNGGLAIFWKKEIDDKIKVMEEGNSRIQVIQIDGFDYYYSAIPDYFYPCYPLSDHSKILSFHLFYAPLLFHGAGLLDLYCCTF
jgi:hypothetical protein